MMARTQSSFTGVLGIVLQPLLPGEANAEGRVLRRHAARGIVLRDEHILLLFTERDTDFSLPDGGVDLGEQIIAALKRDQEQEAGACDVQIRDHQGYIEEYRRHWKKE